MAAHTPGPWSIGDGGNEGDDYATIVSASEPYPIAHLEPRGYKLANARVITAGPDLLAVCILLEGLIRNGIQPGAEDLTQLQLAIAKAKS